MKRVLILALSLFLFISVISLPAMSKSLDDETPALFQEDFSSSLSTAVWDFNTSVTASNGEAIVIPGTTGKFVSAKLVAKQKFQLPQQEDSYLHFAMKINGGQVATGGTLNGFSKIFLAPDPLTTDEPFTMAHSLYIQYEYKGQKDIIISLIKKNNQANSVGTVVYRGTISPSQNPLTVHLYMNRSNYLISFDKQVLTSSGAVSGAHNLPVSTWSGDVRFGLRNYNGIAGFYQELHLDSVYAYNSTLKRDAIIPSKSTFNDQFDSDLSNWITSGGVSASTNQAHVDVNTTGLYDSAKMTLNPKLNLPHEITESYLKVSTKIDGVQEASGGQNTGSGRFFLAPDPVPSGPEPYSMSDAIWIYYNYDGTNNTIISLYKKDNQPNQLGTLLYQGSFNPNQYPLVIGLSVNQGQYKIEFDKTVTTLSGSLSGNHSLPKSKWNGDIRFGLENVNHVAGYMQQLDLDYIDIGNYSFNEDFDASLANWNASTGVTAVNGQADLGVATTGLYDAATLISNQKLQMPEKTSDHYLQASFKIDGVYEEGSGTNTGTGRFFLIPDPLPQYVEPYTNPDVLWVMYEYNGANDAVIKLYSKNNQANSYGTLLYSGSFAANQYPLGISLYANQGTYRIEFDKQVTTLSGATSGLHTLQETVWDGDIRFGVKNVNGVAGYKQHLLVDYVNIGLSPVTDLHQARTASIESQAAADEFAGTLSSWTYDSSVSISNGQAIVDTGTTDLYGGAKLVLNQQLSLPQDTDQNRYLHTQFKIDGVKEATGGTNQGSGRFFVAPDSLPTTPEPYAMAEALWIYYEYNGTNDVVIKLFSKNNQPNAWGTLLYQGTLPAAQMPVTINLFANRKYYQLDFDKTVTTQSGALYGAHTLPASAYSGNVRFGMRNVNHVAGYTQQLLLDSFQAGYAMTAVNEVRILPKKTASVNSNSQTNGIFGAGVNGYIGYSSMSDIQALKLNSLRVFAWFMRGTTPWTPWLAEQFGGNPVTEAEALSLWDTWYQRDFAADIAQYYSDHINDTTGPGTQMRQLQLIRPSNWNTTSKLVFAPLELDGVAENYRTELADYYDEYINKVLEVAPEVNVDYIQLSNEPDFAHFSGMYSTNAAAVTSWLTIFNRLRDDLSSSHPNTKLIGPTMSSENYYTWSGWQDWTVPFLTNATEVNFFNHHIYNMTASSVRAWASMLQSKALNLRNVRTSSIITETNYLDAPSSKDRYIWDAEQIFMMLSNSDKFSLREYFLLGYGKAYNDAHLLKETTPPDTDPPVFETTAPYWLHWTLADTRGEQRSVLPVADPAIKAYASTPDSTHLVVSLFNDTNADKTVYVNPAFETGTTVSGITKRQVYYDGGGTLTHNETTLTANADPIAVTLPANGTVSIKWTVNESAITSSSTASETEFFSADTAVNVGSTSYTAAIATTRTPNSDERVSLRLGIFTDDVLFAKEMQISLNGVPYRIKWSDLIQEKGSRGVSTWFVEIPVQSSTIGTSNKVLFTAQDAAYTMMSASLVYQQ